MPLLDDTLTFFGAPRFSATACDAPAAVIFGIASALGSTFADSRNGPYFIRRLSQHYVWQAERPTLLDLRQPMFDLDALYDAGDIVCTQQDALARDVDAFMSVLPQGCVPIAVGGDHSITLPMVASLKRIASRPFKVISFDHHLDYQFWTRERAELFHTNVMTHVSDLLGPGCVTHIGVEPVQTVDADLRDWYRAYLKRAGAQAPLLSSQIGDDREILNIVGAGQDIYISIDLDVLADVEMSSTPYPSANGLRVERLVELVRLIAGANRVIGADIVEFCAPLDDRQKTTLSDAARAAALLLELATCVAGERSGARRDVAQATLSEGAVQW